MYAIFRRTFDFWLIDAADKWKRDKNMKYIDVYKEQNQRILCIKICYKKLRL